MPKFYVLVSQIGSARVIPDLSGQLWSKNYAKASEEAKEWADDVRVNGGLPIEFLLDEFYVVSVVAEGMAKKVRYFRKFKNNRHTDPIWETLRGRELEERIHARTKSIS